jgi:hypothetical protein
MRGMTNEEILVAEDILHRMKLRLIEMNNQTKQGPDDKIENPDSLLLTD